MRPLTIIASLLLAGAMPSAAGATTIINGSFEQGPNPGLFTEVGVGGGNLVGWNVVSGSVDHIGSFWNAGEGMRSIDLSGRNAGTISQVLSTVSGNSYVVNFLFSVNPGGYTRNDILEVVAGNAAAQLYGFGGGPNSATSMGWERRSYGFTANGDTTPLSFRSLSDSVAGPALDDIRIDTIAAVPEPATWAMMILGMGAVGYRLRQRNRNQGKLAHVA